jgi:ribosomal protein S27AE
MTIFCFGCHWLGDEFDVSSTYEEEPDGSFYGSMQACPKCGADMTKDGFDLDIKFDVYRIVEQVQESTCPACGGYLMKSSHGDAWAGDYEEFWYCSRCGLLSSDIEDVYDWIEQQD